jgi:ADP-glucose pyrophosphorylase
VFCYAHFWPTAATFLFFTSLHVRVPAAPQAVDFSRDILSLMHGELHIAAYPFHGYWEDVGSLKDYYAANMAMASDVSERGAT